MCGNRLAGGCSGFLGWRFFFSSRRRHTRLQGDWSSDVCSSDLFDFLKRSELVRRGLASGKTRRRRARNALSRAIEYSLTMKLVLFAGFVIGLGLLIFKIGRASCRERVVIWVVVESIIEYMQINR